MRYLEKKLKEMFIYFKKDGYTGSGCTATNKLGKDIDVPRKTTPTEMKMALFPDYSNGSKFDNDINVAIKNNDEADCNQCEHLNLTEQEQSQTKEPHICQFYNTRVLHNAHRQPHNSKLFPCIECVKDTYKEYKPKYILRRNRNDK